MENKLIVVTGPTASGKTHKAVALAERISGEIISADSRQLYRGMDIGTGKDLCEYGNVPYHLIDICDAGYKYNLYEYLRDYDAVYKQVVQRGNVPIICGGTGLYIESVLNGLKLPEVPENKELRSRLADRSLQELTDILSGMKVLHNSTDVDTVKRAVRAIEIETYYAEHPELSQNVKPTPIDDYVIIGIDIDREARRRRISERLHSRLDGGMVEEVKSLLDSGIPAEDLVYYGLEYKYVTNYLTGKISYDDMVSGLEIAIHQFAKRQMTWFRGMKRRGFKINWLPYDMADDEFVEESLSLINQ